MSSKWAISGIFGGIWVVGCSSFPTEGASTGLSSSGSSSNIIESNSSPLLRGAGLETLSGERPSNAAMSGSLDTGGAAERRKPYPPPYPSSALLRANICFCSSSSGTRACSSCRALISSSISAILRLARREISKIKHKARMITRTPATMSGRYGAMASSNVGSVSEASMATMYSIFVSNPLSFVIVQMSE